ncbi:MAG: type II toxin-antitoxin system PemK/MazF family toxin [Thaumarchaeota archaeon]|nr:type II toxin-antitoxin system PemK/MazF family toxin [Nitrososphaerota archaeon]
MSWQFKLKPRDIVQADPGYEDQKDEKVRPLLVVSRPLFHQNGRFFISLGITTNQEKDPYLIPITSKDTAHILQEKSQVMCKRIVTVSQSRILRKLTEVTPSFYSVIMKKIKDDIIEM